MNFVRMWFHVVSRMKSSLGLIALLTFLISCGHSEGDRFGPGLATQIASPLNYSLTQIISNQANPNLDVFFTANQQFINSDIVQLVSGSCPGGSVLGTFTGSPSGTITNIPVTGTLVPNVVTKIYSLVNDNGDVYCSSNYIEYIYDTIPPSIPQISLSSPAVSPNTSNAPIFQLNAQGGVFDVNDTLSLHLNSSCSDSPLDTLTLTSTTSVANLQAIGVPHAVAQTYYALATDPAGNTSCSQIASINQSANYQFFISGGGGGGPGTPPPVSNITLINPSSSPGNTGTPTVRVALPSGFNYLAGDIVKIYNGACPGGTVITTTTSPGSGQFVDLVLSPALAANIVHSLTAEVTNASSLSTCASNSVNYEYDTLAPGAPGPIILSYLTPASSPSNNQSPTFNVTLPNAPVFVAADTVELMSGSCPGGTIIGTNTSPSGLVSPVSVSAPLANGSYTVFSKVYDSVGNTLCSNGLSYVVDTIAPSNPGLAYNNPASSPANNNQPILAFNGGDPFAAGDTLNIYPGNISGGCTGTPDVTEIVNTGDPEVGSSTINLQVAVIPSPSTIYYWAEHIDAAGNTTCAPTGLVYQYATPGAPQATTITLINPSSSPGNTGTPTVRVALPSGFNYLAGDSVKIYNGACPGGTVITTTTSPGSGQFVDLVLSPALAANIVHSLTAEVTNAASLSTCASNSVNYEYDTLAPGAPGPIVLSYLTPSSSPSNNQSPTFNVTLPTPATFAAGDTVELMSGSCPGGTVLGSNASPSGGLSPVSVASPLANGTYTVFARTFDSLGNSLCTNSLSYVVTPSAAPTPNIVFNNPASSPSNVAAPIFDVTLTTPDVYQGGDTVNIRQGSCTGSIVSTTSASAGTLVTMPAVAPALSANANYVFYAEIIRAGASACSAVLNYTFDNIPPFAAALSLTTAPVPNGANIYSDPDPLVTITSPLPFATTDNVTIYDGVGCVGTGVFTGNPPTASSSFAVLTSTLAIGSHTLSVLVTDDAGNTTCSVTSGELTYILDTSPPPPATLALVNPVSSPGNIGTPTLSATLPGSLVYDPTDTINIYDGASCTGTVVGTESAPTATNSNNIVLAPALAQGTHNFYVEVVDAAGNATCNSVPLTYIYDSIAPAMPSLVLNIPSPNNDSTPDFTVTLGGAETILAGDIFELFDGASCGGTLMATQTIGGGSPLIGTNNLIMISNALSPDGSYDYYIKMTDAAGNSTCNPIPVNYILDTTPPEIPQIALFNPLTSPGNDPRPIFKIDSESGTNWDAGDLITIHNLNTCADTPIESYTLTANLNTHNLATTNQVVHNTNLTFYVAVSDPYGNTVCSQLATTNQSVIYKFISEVVPVAANSGNWNNYYEISNLSQCPTYSPTRNCVHGGERKKYLVPGQTSCNNLAATDSLLAFYWECDDTDPSGDVYFYSQGLNKDKGLRDLLNAASWKPMSLTVTSSGSGLITTTSNTWWTNPVLPLDNPSTATGVAPASGFWAGYWDLTTSYGIYTFSADQTGEPGYSIIDVNGVEGVAMVGLGTNKINLALSYTNNCRSGSYKTGICFSGGNYNWIENLEATNATGFNHFIEKTAGEFLVAREINSMVSPLYFDSSFSEYKDISVSSTNGNGISFRSTYSRFNRIISNNNNGSGVSFDTFSSAQFNILNNFKALNNGTTGISIGGSTIANNLFSTTGIQFGSNFISHNLTNLNSESVGLSLNNIFDGQLSNYLSINANRSIYAGFGSNGVFNFHNIAIVSDGNFSSEGAIKSENNPSLSLNFTGDVLLGDQIKDCDINPAVTTNLIGNSTTGFNCNTSDPNLNLITGASANNTLLGFVPSDSANGSAIPGSGFINYGAITDWENFDNWYRGFTRAGSTTFIDNANDERCDGSEICGLFDASLKTGDTGVAGGPVALGTNQCPGSEDYFSSTTTGNYLMNAVEIMEDFIGNDDGLCQSGEDCIFSPNIGAYQGHGPLVPSSCPAIGAGGTISDVNLFDFTTNGY